MSESVTYALELRDQDGNLSTGKLTLSFPDSSEVNEARTARKLQQLKQTSSIEKVSGTLLNATLEAESITGVSSYETSGLEYADYEYGLPIATILTGSSGDSDIGISFNEIDSPGTHLGGAISWRPNGPSGENIAYTFLGATT